MVDINMTEIIKRLLKEITPESVLSEIGISETDQTWDGVMLSCPCPIHRDIINKTLKIDLRINYYKCDWHQCSGSRGGDLLDLYCKAKPCTLREGIDFWSKKLNLIPSCQETQISVQEKNQQLLSKVFYDLQKNFSRRLESQVKWAKQYHYPVSLIIIRFPGLVRDIAFRESLYKYHWVEKVLDLLSQFVETKNQVGYHEPDFFTVMIPLLKQEEANTTAQKIIARIRETKTCFGMNSIEILYGIGYYSGTAEGDLTPESFIQETLNKCIIFPRPNIIPQQVMSPSTILEPLLAGIIK